MTAVLGILTAVVLLLLVPVRVTARAETGQAPSATLRYLFFSMPLYPRPQPKERGEKQKKGGKPEKEKDKKPGRDLRPLLTQLLSRFERLSRPVQKLLRRTGIARFSLRVVVVGEDAAATALRFGCANAAIFSAVAVLDRIFALRVKQIDIIPGFAAEQEEYSFSGEARVVPLAALAAALQLGFWGLVALIKSAGAPNESNENRRKASAGRKEDCYGKQAPDQ